VESASKPSSVRTKENPRPRYLAELRLRSTNVVRGSSRRIMTMWRLRPIHEYQSDQSSATYLDGLLVESTGA
jgi:hypothetical protein